MSSRRTARKNAFLALYQSDVTGRPMTEILERWRSYRGELDEHAEKLTLAVEREKEALDELLGEVAVGWPVHRMSAIDRTILRLALYEMLHVEDVPAEVAINEAIELARGFSSDEAPQFVGGVLRGAKEAWLGETERHDWRVEHG
ncbi:MAG: transcription antitermination protein NusB [Rubrobacteraceae bacterium]|nr:transcription antitermination protein NusB [Rubrobacteraceae bacterium]